MIKEELNEILKEHEDLIGITRKYLDILLNIYSEKDFLLILTDKNSIAIYQNGSYKIIKKVNIALGENIKSLELENSKIINIYKYDGEFLGHFFLVDNSFNKEELNLLLKFISKLIEEESVNFVCNKRRCENKSTGAIAKYCDIIGESDEIKEVIEISKQVSNSPSTILIEGESGTGKELLAQSIHNYSNRRDENFVAINCGAIPSNIIESELFGYEDGTFTGGKKGGKIGKFESANGGTLFLDEIGEMPIDMQVKLLRVLQEDKITRLGGNREISIDVRIIVATNKNLREEVLKGNFREDLFYRLCVIPIRIPPLRERKGDLDKLIEYFLEIKSVKLNRIKPELSKDLYNQLLGYDWPGNIRQLENCIENIVNLGGTLSINMKESTFRTINNKRQEENKDYNLRNMEKFLIQEAILYNNRNFTKAAKDLGISRNTLYLKIKKYNIQI